MLWGGELVSLLTLFSVVFTMAVLTACARTEEPATLVLRNGKIVTVDEERPEAEALAVRGDRIIAVGSNGEVEPYIGPDTEILDLNGALALPGFIEGHGHFMWLGETKMSLDLGVARSWDDVVRMVAKAVVQAKPGEWIRGYGWHQAKWEHPPTPNVRGYPVHEALSAASPENPVLLTHDSGHGSFANTKAMELAGITQDTPDPEGGEILKDADGRPIGMFVDNAAWLVDPGARSENARPLEGIDAFPGGEDLNRRRAELAARECIAKGVTTFHDAGAAPETIDLYTTLVQEGAMPLRLYVMLSERNERLPDVLPRYKKIGFGDHHLTVRSIKKVADGALGAHGAWMLGPYSDLSTTQGIMRESMANVGETARLAVQHGFQLCVHAIGDRANREVLDVFDAANPERRDRRWRIEHAQILDREDFPRFAELGVIASMQAVHCPSDAAFVVERIGEDRAREGAYAWRSLLDAGAVVTNGTDVPVEDVDPIAGFYASVTRKREDGSIFFGEQRMTRTEALKSYTLDNAYAAFEEELKGSLTPGKLADIVVLSKDIMTIPEEEIRNAEVLYTLIGGNVVYRRDD